MSMRPSLCLALALTVLAGPAGAVSRPVAVNTYYDGVQVARLLDTYQRAYVRAGFVFAGRTAQTTNAGTQTLTRLKFTYPDRTAPGKLKGVASFVILSPRAGGKCSPCDLHQETLGVVGPYEADHYQRYTELLLRLQAADRDAKLEIRRELGSSPAAFDETRPPGPGEPTP